MELNAQFPTGALSLLYHLSNTEEVRTRFKVDSTAVMKEFGLSEGAQSVIKAAGDDLNSEGIGTVMTLVQKEIEQRGETMW